MSEKQDKLDNIKKLLDSIEKEKVIVQQATPKLLEAVVAVSELEQVGDAIDKAINELHMKKIEYTVKPCTCMLSDRAYDSNIIVEGRFVPLSVTVDELVQKIKEKGINVVRWDTLEYKSKRTDHFFKFVFCILAEPFVTKETTVM